MLKLRNLIEMAVSDPDIFDEMETVLNQTAQEFKSGAKRQSWRLVPSRLLKTTWLGFAKYGRVDESSLDKIWEIIKENCLKILVNSEIVHGLHAIEIFDKDTDSGEEVPAEDFRRFLHFILDNSGAGYISRNDAEAALPRGHGRYSDAHNTLYKIFKRAYSASSPEEQLIAIDQILNFVHGIGHMADWFIAGGVDTLADLRDMGIKGIHLQGKLTENRFPAIKTKSGKVYLGRIHADAVGKTEEDLESVGWWEDGQYYTEEEARRKWGRASTDDLEPELHRAWRTNRQVPEIPDTPVNENTFHQRWRYNN